MPASSADMTRPVSAMKRPRFGVALAWLPAVMVLIPALVVFVRLVEPVGGAWSYLVETLLASYVWHTVLLLVLVCGLALLFGVPTAWWVATYDFPGRRFFHWALLLPLAMPGYISALAYVDATESLVPVYVWVRQHHGVEAFLLAQDASRWALAVIVLGSTLFPYVYLTAAASFSRQTSGMLEAARTLGASRRRLFWTIALPMARPAIVAGVSLVAFETLNDYGVVSYFGLTPLTVGVFRLWLSEGELNAAIRLSTLLLLFAVGGLAMERMQRGRRAFAAETSEAVLTRRRLGVGRGLSMAFLCLIPLAVGFLVPCWRLVRWAWQSLHEADWKHTLEAAWHSFSLAAGAALLIVAAAVLLLSTRRAVQAPSLRWAQKIGLLGYAFPSALVAVGVGSLLSSLATVPGFGYVALSASATGLVFAYFVRFLAVGIQPVDSGFRRIPPSLHEAARTLGCSPWRALFRVDVPLLWPSLFAAGTLAFIDIFKELTLTLVLRPFDFETLATRVFRLTDEGRIPEAALPALILISLSLVGLIPLTHFSQRRAS